MIKINYKNLEKSELVSEAASQRIKSIIQKFPDLQQSRITLTLEMENSPQQPGPDVFKVSLHVSGGRYRDVRIEKSAPNLYVALAYLVEHMLEKLNRFGDRARVKLRTQARRPSERKEEFDPMEDMDDEVLILTEYEQRLAK